MKNKAYALKEAISLLENKQVIELELLKDQFHLACESLKPINLVKSILHEMVSSSNIKNSLANNAIGLVTGYLSKKVVMGGSHNLFKRLLGTLLQFTVANIVSKHSDVIKERGEALIHYVFKNRNQVKESFINTNNKK